MAARISSFGGSALMPRSSSVSVLLLLRTLHEDARHSNESCCPPQRTTNHRHIKQLEQFHTRALRMVRDIRWQDRVTNQEVLDRAGSTSIESLLLKAQLRWTGHVIRMSDSRIPRQLLYGELRHGSRKQGKPKLRFKDTLESTNSNGAVLVHVNLRPLLQTTAWLA